MDVDAGGLILHLLTADEADRVLRGVLLAGETWADGYPSTEQVDYLQAYLVETKSAHPEHSWQSQLRRRKDGLVVGGAGVTGPPDADGAVVIGYELADGLSNAQYGVDIVRALIEVARDMGARRAITEVFDDDHVRRQVYRYAGLSESRRDGRVVHLGCDL